MPQISCLDCIIGLSKKGGENSLDSKRIVSLISGMAAAALLIPGMIMTFGSPAGINTAVLILIILHIAAIVLSILGAVLTIIGAKRAAAVFVSAGISAVLCLLLMLYMLLSIEITVILTAASIILIFTAAKICPRFK